MMNDDPTAARHHLFLLLAHLMTATSDPIPHDLRQWLLAGFQRYLDRPTTLDVALGLRARGRAHPAREWRIDQRDRTLRDHTARLDPRPQIGELQAAIRRRRRRAPGRAAVTPIERAIDAAWTYAPVPDSEAQLRRILATDRA